jgi:hypothetical protein
VSETDPGTGKGAQWSLNGTSSAPNFGFLGNYDNTTPFPGGVPVDFNWIFGAQNVDVVDKETWAKLDATYLMPDSGAWKALKFGARQTWHSRESNNAIAQGPAGSNFTNPTANYPTTWSNYPSGLQYFRRQHPDRRLVLDSAQLHTYNGPGLVNRDPSRVSTTSTCLARSSATRRLTCRRTSRASAGPATSGCVTRTNGVSTTYTQVPATYPGAHHDLGFGPFGHPGGAHLQRRAA